MCKTLTIIPHTKKKIKDQFIHKLIKSEELTWTIKKKQFKKKIQTDRLWHLFRRIA